MTPSWDFVLAGAALGCAAVPAVMVLRNLGRYRPAPAAEGSSADLTTDPGGAAVRSLAHSDDGPHVSSRAGAPDAGRSGGTDKSGKTVSPPSVSILIPARNEEAAIGDAVRAALAQRGADVEVVVLDDHSEDRTAAVVRDLAAGDPRVRLETPPPLPDGWCGKQHACWVLAQRAGRPLLLFQDADVRLAPDAAARLAAFRTASGADLVSGIPHQITGTLVERMLIPLIHFVLLGFLPMGMMRRDRSPKFGSGCGQLFLADRAAYFETGGHSAIRASLHDGIKLPRAFRSAGRMTDLCDATDLAECRMYRSGGEVWRGLGKNATEGLAHPAVIGPATVLLLMGQVVPFVLAAVLGVAVLTQRADAAGSDGPGADDATHGSTASAAGEDPCLQCTGDSCPIAAFVAGGSVPPDGSPPVAGLMTRSGAGLTLAALVAAWLPRWVLAWRFRQSAVGAALHPAGIVALLVIQWWALLRRVLGRRSDWKGRQYAGAA